MTTQQKAGVEAEEGLGKDRDLLFGVGKRLKPKKN